MGILESWGDVAVESVCRLNFGCWLLAAGPWPKATMRTTSFYKMTSFRHSSPGTPPLYPILSYPTKMYMSHKNSIHQIQ